MTDDVAIRLARSDDADGISELIMTLSGVFIVDPTEADRFRETISPSAIAGYLADDTFRYHVATVHAAGVHASDTNGVIAGCVAMRDRTHLYHLFVAESLQGRGVARRLWNRAREAAEAEHAISRFTVNASLNAHGLYRHLGFRDVGNVVRTDGLAFQPMELIADQA